LISHTIATITALPSLQKLVKMPQTLNFSVSTRSHELHLKRHHQPNIERSCTSEILPACLQQSFSPMVSLRLPIALTIKPMDPLCQIDMQTFGQPRFRIQLRLSPVSVNNIPCHTQVAGNVRNQALQLVLLSAASPR